MVTNLVTSISSWLRIWFTPFLVGYGFGSPHSKMGVNLDSTLWLESASTIPMETG